MVINSVIRMYSLFIVEMSCCRHVRITYLFGIMQISKYIPNNFTTVINYMTTKPGKFYKVDLIQFVIKTK